MTIATEKEKAQAKIWTDEEFMDLPDRSDLYFKVALSDLLRTLDF
jgi:hypothetical protein